MKYKELGKIGVQLSEIGLGTWKYSGGVEPLQIGIAHGANFIDMAESYGTEEVVGQAIRGRRNEVLLATKVSPRHFRYRDVVRSAEQSLKRLGTDCIDLYQLHWPNHTVPIAETMGAMEELVDNGKIRFIGVSSFPLYELRQAQNAMKKHKIVSNQVRYNLTDRTIERDVLPYCQEQGITLLAHSPLGNRMTTLTKSDPRGVLNEVAARTGKSVAQVALGWCISSKGVVAIPKSDSADHIRENCDASGSGLSEADIELLEKQIRFRSRGHVETRIRRITRHALQLIGREL